MQQGLATLLRFAYGEFQGFLKFDERPLLHVPTRTPCRPPQLYDDRPAERRDSAGLQAFVGANVSVTVSGLVCRRPPAVSLFPLFAVFFRFVAGLLFVVGLLFDTLLGLVALLVRRPTSGFMLSLCALLPLSLRSSFSLRSLLIRAFSSRRARLPSQFSPHLSSGSPLVGAFSPYCSSRRSHIATVPLSGNCRPRVPLERSRRWRP